MKLNDCRPYYSPYIKWNTKNGIDDIHSSLSCLFLYITYPLKYMKSGFIWLELLLLSFFLIMLDINYISFVFHRENMPMYFIVRKLSYASLSTINDFYSILVIYNFVTYVLKNAFLLYGKWQVYVLRYLDHNVTHSSYNIEFYRGH